MKKILILLFTALSFWNCNEPDPVTFPEKALNDVFIKPDTASISFQEILEKHDGKTLFIDVWASWCKDCIVGMPKVKALQAAYPEVVFLFLSMDKTMASWEKGIKRFSIEKGDHYLLPKGWKSDFAKAMDIDWIPRYLIVNPEGKISLFEAIKADDPRIKSLL